MKYIKLIFLTVLTALSGSLLSQEPDFYDIIISDVVIVDEGCEVLGGGIWSYQQLEVTLSNIGTLSIGYPYSVSSELGFTNEYIDGQLSSNEAIILPGESLVISGQINSFNTPWTAGQSNMLTVSFGSGPDFTETGDALLNNTYEIFQAEDIDCSNLSIIDIELDGYYSAVDCNPTSINNTLEFGLYFETDTLYSICSHTEILNTNTGVVNEFDFCFPPIYASNFPTTNSFTVTLGALNIPIDGDTYQVTSYITDYSATGLDSNAENDTVSYTVDTSVYDYDNCVYGCTDATACNYDYTADVNDNSCIYADDPCEQCDGFGGVLVGDIDGDGICDNDEISGCTDPSAVNYDNTATDDNGTCVYSCATVEFDGYTYNAIQIGSQCWFDENLRSTIYANGDVIPAGLTDGEWISTTSGATAVYGEGSSNCQENSPDIDACDEVQSLAEYGRLYNGWATIDSRGLCPTGWHVPTNGEWTVLENFITSQGFNGTEGTALKSTYGWSEDFNGGNGTDDFGFSGLPGGYRSAWNGSFLASGYFGEWWSSSSVGSGNIWNRSLSHYESELDNNTPTPVFGFSVRCIQSPIILGCTDSTADNYDDTATEDDGSCTYSIIPGCTDATALNYDDTATEDDGSCVYSCATVEFDNYTYNAVQIGNQCWFDENLRSTIYANGDVISPITSLDLMTLINNSNQIGYNTVYGESDFGCSDSSPDFDACDETLSLQEYGRLYNWFAVDDERGLCPTGWVVPNLEHWSELMDYMDTQDIDISLALPSTSGWANNLSDLFTNEVAFSGLPGGEFNVGDFGGQYLQSGYYSYTWVGEPVSTLPTTIYTTVLGGGSFGFSTGVIGDGSLWPQENNARSVRCIRNTPGCTDTNAFNYNEDADYDDGSCLYYCASVEFDGYTYNGVQIGDQCWFSENLRTTKFANGIDIPEVTNLQDWIDTDSPARCYFNNDPANEANWGMLYNGYASNYLASTEICPTGWHLPTSGEFNVLNDYLVSQGENTLNIRSITGWQVGNAGGNGTDSYGFNAYPSGVRGLNPDSPNDGFGGDGDGAYFHTPSSTIRAITNDFFQISGNIYEQGNGASIRCIVQMGCLDSGACNYNPDATLDSENCVYADDPCETCNPDGTVNPNDDDNDGVCNDDEVLGCTDSQALNYNPNATDDDGSCEFLCNQVEYNGYVYDVIQIGTQCWFAENLKTTTFQNGDIIPTGDAIQWFNQSLTGNPLSSDISETYSNVECGVWSFDYYNDLCGTSEGLDVYGRHYNAMAVQDVRGLCPSGWHIPTDEEWKVMEQYIGMPVEDLDLISDYDERGGALSANGPLELGLKLKSSIPGSWDGELGTDIYEFNALPAGIRLFNQMTQGGIYSYFWTYTSYDLNNLYYRSIKSNISGSLFDKGIARSYASNDVGMSIRCIQIPGQGCTDPTSCTYDLEATEDDGSCEYLDECGVCGGDGIADGACDCDGNFPDVGYDCDGNPIDCIADTDGDGVCDEYEVPGCTNQYACNYNPEATDEDGSCDFTSCLGCTDPIACNYDPNATIDDFSCQYPVEGYDCGCNLLCPGDFNGDGVRTTSDLLILLSQYGNICN